MSGGPTDTVAALAAVDLRPGRTPPARWLSVRLRGPRLDRELAAGVPSWQSPAHAARALQLTSLRRRRALARTLERLVADAQSPPTRYLNASIRPRRGQVVPAAPLMRGIARRLRSGAPVEARGIAALQAVLGDGDGPCYSGGRSGALSTRLQAVSAWLDVED